MRRHTIAPIVATLRRLSRRLVPLALLAGAVSTVAPAPAQAGPDTTRGQAWVMVDHLADRTEVVHSYHSWGGVNTVANPVQGRWTVHLGGFTAAGGNVQLTQYILTGAGAHGYCAVESWLPDATGTNVNVRCWADDGTPAVQVSFAVLFDNSLTMPSSLYEAFVLFNGSFTGYYVPTGSFVVNGAPRLTHTSAGHYTAEWLGAFVNPFPVVTAVATVPRVCNVVDWTTGRSTISPHEVGSFVRIACFDFAGNPADTAFSYMMSSRSPLGVDGTSGGRLYAPGYAPKPVTPAVDNVNTRAGSAVADNSYVTAPAGTASGYTQLTVPGYPGADGALYGVDTLESVGDDGTRCSLESPPVRSNGNALLLALCVRPDGLSILHSVHGGTWSW
jgi:hypothetical protein